MKTSRKTLRARLIQRRGKSCGKVGYFFTSIVPGQKTERGFFTTDRMQDSLATAFREAHEDRVFATLHTR